MRSPDPRVRSPNPDLPSLPIWAQDLQMAVRNILRSRSPARREQSDISVYEKGGRREHDLAVLDKMWNSGMIVRMSSFTVAILAWRAMRQVFTLIHQIHDIGMPGIVIS